MKASVVKRPVRGWDTAFDSTGSFELWSTTVSTALQYATVNSKSTWSSTVDIGDLNIGKVFDALPDNPMQTLCALTGPLCQFGLTNTVVSASCFRIFSFFFQYCGPI
jgi:hypothetical protein